MAKNIDIDEVIAELKKLFPHVRLLALKIFSWFVNILKYANYIKYCVYFSLNFSNRK